MQYFRWERRAAASAWTGALYASPPKTQGADFKFGPTHEVEDGVGLRDCAKLFPFPNAEQIAVAKIEAEINKPPEKPEEPETVPFDPAPKGGPLSGGSSVVCYRNRRGEVSIRKVKLICLWFGSSQWYPDDQWFLKVWDLEKDAERDFALSGFVSPEGVSYSVTGKLSSNMVDIARRGGVDVMSL